jgi:putative addiction module component (TIGR02574 family)
MITRLEEIEKAALELSEAERTRLISSLSRSLSDNDPAIENAWIDEADRRWQEIKAGKAKTIPYEQVLSKIQARADAQG